MGQDKGDERDAWRYACCQVEILSYSVRKDWMRLVVCGWVGGVTGVERKEVDVSRSGGTPEIAFMRWSREEGVGSMVMYCVQVWESRARGLCLVRAMIIYGDGENRVLW